MRTGVAVKPRRSLLGPAVFLAAAVCAVPCAAQDAKGFRVTAEAAAPRGAQSADYRKVANRSFAETDVTYAETIEGDLSEGLAPAERRRRSGGGEFSVGNGSGIGVFLAVAGLMVALLLWMKFGGAGVLLSREPRELKRRQEAPESWAMTGAEADMDADTLLKTLASMSDRREALVRLLRHCLLFAADDSDTRFARSDTEREAFGRLPDEWRHREALGALLQHTELAHYGGRDVNETTFSGLLEIAGHMLQGRKRLANA